VALEIIEQLRGELAPALAELVAKAQRKKPAFVEEPNPELILRLEQRRR